MIAAVHSREKNSIQANYFFSLGNVYVAGVTIPNKTIFPNVQSLT
jgi:hypothetical protein